MREPSRQMTPEELLFYKSTRGAAFNISLSVVQVTTLLELAEEKVLYDPTRVVFKALQRKGFIKVNHSNDKYELTEAGEHILQLIRLADWTLKRRE